jgi:hypothetical protein
LRNGTRIAALAAASFTLVAAGCQSNQGGTGLEGAAQPQRVVTESELRAYCPSITMRAGTSFFTRYERGGDQDPTKIIYQASISDVTRACTYDGGNVTINAAVVGRIVTGPVGGPGSITLPIRIVVVRGAEVLYSQLHNYQVTVSGGVGATQFTFSDPAITIPMPAERNVQIFAGFDEGDGS